LDDPDKTTIRPHSSTQLNSELKATITGCHNGQKFPGQDIYGNKDTGWLMEEWFYTFNLYKDDGSEYKENNLITLRHRYAEHLNTSRSYEKAYYAGTEIIDSDMKTNKEKVTATNSCNMVAQMFHGSTPVVTTLTIDVNGKIDATTRCD